LESVVHTEKATVPNIIGKTETQAKDLITAAKLKYKILYVIDDNKTAGEVFKQSVATNTSVKINTVIEFSVYTKTQQVSVPNLIGKTETQAKDLLASEKLNFKIIYVIDDNQTAGVVFKQSVAANTSVKIGAIIDVSVYSKSPQITVPAFSGKTLATYKTEAENLGFKITSQESFSDTVTSGQIISVSPSVGTKANKGSTINVVVSKGKSIVTVKVPAGVGGSYTIFQTNATNVGLVASKTDKCSNTVANGSIISMNPAEGTTVNQGSTVNVVVSSGLCPWSAWVTSLPAGVSTATHDIESKTQYQFRDKETTTASTSTLAGWIKYNEVVTGYGSWGAWQKSVLTESSAINVETRTVYVFTRYRWKNPQGSIGVSYSYTKFAAFSVPDFYQEIRIPNLSMVTFRLTDEYSWHYFRIPFNADLMINQWFGASSSPWIGNFDKNMIYNTTNSEGNTEWYSKSKTGRSETEYRSRTKIYTYYFYRWTAWSAWQDAVVTSSANKEVQTRTVYRYRSK
jgi:beta-lactam-binding protein with PASTA domain